MDSLAPIANETDLDLPFSAIEIELDNFQLPDISLIDESLEKTRGDTSDYLPPAKSSAAAPAPSPSAHHTNIQSINLIDSSRNTDLRPPNELLLLGERRRPTHILPRKELLRWDFLLESLKGDHGTVRSELSGALRREFDWLEQLAEEKRENKRRQQRKRDATKRSKFNCLSTRASAGDIEARKMQDLIVRKQRLKNVRGSARRKRQREDEVAALLSAPRCFVEPVNFSALLKSFLAAQMLFTGKVNCDFQRRLCQAAQRMHIFKNGVQQKFIHADVSIVNANSTGVLPEIHPSMELSSQHLTAVVEQYTHGNISALVRILYLPIHAGTELHALDAFMKCNDSFVTMPAKQLFLRASTSKSLAEGHSSYNVSVFPICDGLNSLNRKSEATSTGPRNPAWKIPETIFKVAKYEMTCCNFDKQSEDSAPRKSFVFHGIEGMEVWEKCAELGIIGAASSRSMQSATSFSRFRFVVPSRTKPWSADLGLPQGALTTEKRFDFSNTERFRDILMLKWCT